MSRPDAKARKQIPIATGVLAYFPDALAAVAACSVAGNEQHNPGTVLHWDRSKSNDDADALVRHLVDHLRGELVDTDGRLHIAKVAWRALALCQLACEAREAELVKGKESATPAVG